MSNDSGIIFSSRLKAARELRGLTQGELAKKSSFQPSAISHFETGTRKPSFDNLRRLADTLEITIDYLLGRTDEMAGVGPTTDRLNRHISKLTGADMDFAENILKGLAARSENKGK